MVEGEEVVVVVVVEELGDLLFASLRVSADFRER